MKNPQTTVTMQGDTAPNPYPKICPHFDLMTDAALTAVAPPGYRLYNDRTAMRWISKDPRQRAVCIRAWLKYGMAESRRLCLLESWKDYEQNAFGVCPIAGMVPNEAIDEASASSRNACAANKGDMAASSR